MDDDDQSLPEDPHAVRERLRQLWSMVFATPPLYALAAWGLMSLRLVRGPEAIHPWDTPGTRWTIGGLAGIMFVFVIVIRLLRRTALRAPLPDRAEALKRYVRNFYCTIVLSDTISFLGLVYFILSGRMMGLIIGGALTFIGYFIAYPRAGDVNELE